MLDKSKQYLFENFPRDQKLLLALSGGVDSMALFHLLLDRGQSFEVCHVDHGWRDESGEEAKLLEKLCYEKKVPFHLQRIKEFDYRKGNLEDRLRCKRYKLLNEIYQKIEAKALLLGHHQNDQAETLLKRLLEGTSLFHMGGIAIQSNRDGMELVRPLLFHSKLELEEYVCSKDSFYFQDSTNFDRTYLRARMREEMIPALEKAFGKNIQQNLIHLGSMSNQINQYLHKQVKPYLDQITYGPLGAYVALPSSLDEIELEFIIRHISHQFELSLPRGDLHKLQKIIAQQSCGKKICRENWEIIYDQGYLIFYDSEFQYEISPLVDQMKEIPKMGWKNLWKGQIALYLPHNKCELAKPDLSARFLNGIKLKKWYIKYKVPAILRQSLPVIWDGNQLIGECLTGASECEKPNHLLTLIKKRNKISGLF